MITFQHVNFLLVAAVHPIFKPRVGQCCCHDEYDLAVMTVCSGIYRSKVQLLQLQFGCSVSIMTSATYQGGK